MRLKHIKLAGFKSFVDPTKVPFEKQMTAIVGPNGCGKSNIIDAVRWVLGESSAKNLRGDAMTDVIFNGASTRKPVGQASVELFFDNMDGRIDGSMADRNQVSIRRVVNRDSQNTYFLNGSKCRRKDITDIFLGTGLGPRSYAIIEQGTISRLIESKPQELRVFIEEAAGISKYKERRRDTENRIRHTRENLERLTDIRIELDNQLDKLHQQAEAAKRFRTLKQQERKFKAELALLRWKNFDQQLKAKQAKIAVLQQQIEQSVLEQKSEEIALFTAKQSLQSSNESIQNLQQQKISLTNDIARVEQHIKHVKQQQHKLELDKASNIEQLANAQASLLSEQKQLNNIVTKLDVHQPNFNQLGLKLAELKEKLEIDNGRLDKLQQSWHISNQQKELVAEQQLKEIQDKSELTVGLEQSNKRLESVVAQMLELEQNKQSLLLTRKTDSVCDELTMLQEQIEQLTFDQQNLSEVMEEETDAIAKLDSKRAGCQATLKVTENHISFLESKLDKKSDWELKQANWLGKENIEGIQTLQQKLKVSPGWEKAVEVVLSHKLQALLLPELPFDKLIEGEVPALVNLRVTARDSIAAQPNSLAQHVTGAPEVIALFNGIKVASNYQDALMVLPNLRENESVICPQGTWLSGDFIVQGNLNGDLDYLTFQREFNENLQQRDELLKHEQQLNIMLQKHTERLSKTNNQKSDIKGQLQNKEIRLTELEKQHQLSQQSLSLVEQQLLALETEKQTILEQIQTLKANFAKIEDITSNSRVAKRSEVESIKQINEELKLLQQDVLRTQNNYNDLVQKKHQAELSAEKYKHQHQQYQNNISRFQESISLLTSQQASNSKLIDESHQPLHNDEQQLQTWLAQMAEKDEQLRRSQSRLLEQQNVIDTVEQNQRKAVESTNQIKEQLNQLNLDSESCRLKSESAMEQLVELRQTVQSVQENMPDNARESQWQAHLIKFGKDIQMLGAINLAAIDEFESQITRKNYLDQQDQDLNLAITTLESAIEKIDKESRQKFKTTFDKVNEDLQSLFPKVFGGGSAYLTLTGEDLLDTGITIMARPPGKKNSTIHLLSGGEKALTALSLVFAIFRLNPAPFCMLDEVDAPLDDANVSRFCNLVEEMSQTVQFIYISHNKIAMEMAAHLTGVTMFEAGVSRMVAVDIDEAVAMAEVS